MQFLRRRPTAVAAAKTRVFISLRLVKSRKKAFLNPFFDLSAQPLNAATAADQAAACVSLVAINMVAELALRAAAAPYSMLRMLHYLAGDKLGGDKNGRTALRQRQNYVPCAGSSCGPHRMHVSALLRAAAPFCLRSLL